MGRLFHTMNAFGTQAFIHVGFTDDSPTKIAEPSDFDMGDTLYYSKVYVNTPTDLTGDKHFASSIASYRINDHTGYYRFAGRSLCSYEMSDSFLQQSTVAELFYL